MGAHISYALHRETEHWARETLDAYGETSPESGPPEKEYREEQYPEEWAPETVTCWRTVHLRMVALGVERAKHERELCRWLAAAERLDTPSRAGFASLAEYAQRHVGLSARRTEERLRVGKLLPSLPTIDQAFREGRLQWSKVREITRIANADTERAWVDWAEPRGAREVEWAVARRGEGETPDDPGDPSRATHRLSFAVRAETLALFRDVQTKIGKELGQKVDDDTLFLELSRRILGGPTDEGRASYQIAVTTCDRCGETSIDAGGESHAVDPAIAEMARCDGQDLGFVGPHVGAGKQRDATADAGSHASPPPDDRGAPSPGPHVGASLVDASAAHLESAEANHPPRATQSIPPALRRRVMRRDRRRCVIPGCRNHRFLDVHHLDPRAEGGGHDPERLVVLCGAHHRCTHLGTLHIEGSASSGFTVVHADGSPYGTRFDPVRLDLARKTQQTLLHLGFKTREARAAVDLVLMAPNTPGDLEAFIRTALRVLG